MSHRSRTPLRGTALQQAPGHLPDSLAQVVKVSDAFSAPFGRYSQLRSVQRPDGQSPCFRAEKWAELKLP
jgi:hypothetical protein